MCATFEPTSLKNTHYVAILEYAKICKKKCKNHQDCCTQKSKMLYNISTFIINVSLMFPKSGTFLNEILEFSSLSCGMYYQVWALHTKYLGV